MLVVEIDEKGHIERPPNYEKGKQEYIGNVGYYFY